MHKPLFLLALLLLLTAATTAAAQSPATGQILGHDYVDLGLSVMWATCNIGASSPSDYGDYFAWGEAETKSTYTENNSTTQGKSSYTFLDAASIHWGSAWRMPTYEDIQELISECNWKWISIGDHNGFLCTGPNGNSIFLPFAGMYGTSLSDSNEIGSYWTSSPYKNDSDNKYANSIKLSWSDLKITAMGYIRVGGRSIRPVADIISEQEKHERSTITGQISGHDYVDLGLSVMWATCNVGANSPSDYGDYFAFGEDQTKYTYSEKNSTTYKKNKYTFLDAARRKWGEKWRLPTKTEYEELVNKCTFRWFEFDGHKGYKVTGPNGKSIFLPAAGYYRDESILDTEKIGRYWSSTPIGDNSYSAYGIKFNLGTLTHGVQGNGRYYGMSVRPVSEK